MDRVTPITISTVCIHLQARARAGLRCCAIYGDPACHAQCAECACAVLLLNGLNTRGRVTCLYRVIMPTTAGRGHRGCLLCLAARLAVWGVWGGLAAVVFHGTTDDPSACRGFEGCPGKQLLMGPGCSTGCPGLAGCA